MIHSRSGSATPRVYKVCGRTSLDKDRQAPCAALLKGFRCLFEMAYWHTRGEKVLDAFSCSHAAINETNMRTAVFVLALAVLSVAPQARATPDSSQLAVTLLAGIPVACFMTAMVGQIVIALQANRMTRRLARTNLRFRD